MLLAGCGVFMLGFKLFSEHMEKLAGNTNIMVNEIEEYEEMVQNMRRVLIADHIDRLKQGKCKPENNTIFINLVSNLERIGEHLYYIVK